MISLIRCLIIFGGILFCNILFSQNDAGYFELNGEFRFRGELNHGYRKLPDKSDHLVGVISQRSRIAASLQKKIYQVKISLQYVMMWGDKNIASKTGVWGDSIGVNLNEAWVHLKLHENLSLTAGRQYFKYDDQRLLAWRNWNQFSLSYDALKVSFAKNEWYADLGLSWNNAFSKLFGKEFGSNNYFDDGLRLKSLNFLYLKKQLGKSYVSLMGIASGVQELGTDNTFKFKYTFGPYFMLQSGGAEFKLNAYLQKGRDALNAKINAYMFSAEAAYATELLKFGAGFDLISGDDPKNNPTKERNDFDLLYGARFKFYGWMNQFGYLPSDTYRAGLIDIYPHISVNVGKKNNFKLYYHIFYLQQKLPGIVIGSELDKNLGSELDFMYSLKFATDIQLNTGISYYFTSPAIEAIKLPAQYGKYLGTPYWVWIMLTVKPGFYKSKSM